ncbi:hypothetical protein TNIN_320511 [Trichonephila inaurata madagascariensis]|uniref:Uncharacterized protein n=1 Tax=Trichonephila inaurata madagascariensis TaxID=2747483 RepID=A0A8X6Y1A3_9ARAC|nr:hypothetical protein TNIN_320511 [Trichonephila inaurata madagascariensis]
MALVEQRVTRGNDKGGEAPGRGTSSTRKGLEKACVPTRAPFPFNGQDQQRRSATSPAATRPPAPGQDADPGAEGAAGRAVQRPGRGNPRGAGRCAAEYAGTGW